MFTRKDFNETAAIVRHALERADRAGDFEYMMHQYTVACMYADTFTRSNPRFDRDKFMTACGFDAEPGETAHAI